MKKLMLMLVLVCLATGCDIAQPGRYEELVANVNDGMTTIADAVKESGFVKDEKMDKLTADMAIITDAASAAAKKLDEQEDKDQLQAGIEAGIAANEASKSINPYYGLIGGILGIALAIKKTLDANKSGAAVREIVAGVEDYKKGAATPAVGLQILKGSLRASTSPATRVIIEAAKK